MEADQDGDGKLSFEEFALMVSNTVRLVAGVILNRVSYRSLILEGHYQANDIRRLVLASISYFMWQSGTAVYGLIQMIDWGNASYFDDFSITPGSFNGNYASYVVRWKRTLFDGPSASGWNPTRGPTYSMCNYFLYYRYSPTRPFTSNCSTASFIVWYTATMNWPRIDSTSSPRH